MKHLFLSLASNSWGRASMTSAIARELAAEGEDVACAVHESLLPLFGDGNFRTEILPSHLCPLAGLWFEQLLCECNPDTLTLGDYFSNAHFLHELAIDTRILLPKNLPIITLDVWNCDEAGFQIDIFDGKSRQVGPGDKDKLAASFASIPYKLRPVPILHPRQTSGIFSNLPQVNANSPERRRSARQAAGLGERVKAVLFCTAEWQHARYRESEAATRLAESLPCLIGEYLLQMNDVHLVHVGPHSYQANICLGDRYHWIPQLSPQDFDLLMGGMDMLLTANIASNIMTKAMLLNVPILALRNSFEASHVENLQQLLRRRVSRTLRVWFERYGPLYPFLVWPLGYRRFLDPLLHGNPFTDALQIGELLDEDGVREALESLLFNPSARDAQLDRQEAYVSRVRALPSGAQVIQATFAA